MRLTDQGLVAVTLARRGAAEQRRPAHVADLVVALASEPEGVAGRLLAAHANAVAALAGRLGAAPPRLPALEVAVAWAAGDVGDRPLGTADLLRAALEVGGSDLADLLERCGLPAEALARTPAPAATPLWVAATGDALSETYGLDPAATDLHPAAARAVARARAVGGGALTLVAALAVEASTDPGAVPLDPEQLAARLRQLEAPVHGSGARVDPEWDAGLDAVIDAAWRIRGGASLSPLDLLRSAALAGGRGPALALGGGAP